MASNLSLMDKDGRKVSTVMDLMNLKNVGKGGCVSRPMAHVRVTTPR